MKNTSKKEELLDELAQELNIPYLSDLSYSVSLENLKKVVKKIPEAKYNIREWQDAVNYLASHRRQTAGTFQTVNEAKDCLLKLYI